MNRDGSIDLSRPVRPLSFRGRSYELLDLSARTLGRYQLFQDALDAIAEWPRRTVFLVRLWTARDGTMAVERRWLVSLGLDGRYRATETQKHWTMRPIAG